MVIFNTTFVDSEGRQRRTNGRTRVLAKSRVLNTLCYGQVGDRRYMCPYVGVSKIMGCPIDRFKSPGLYIFNELSISYCGCYTVHDENVSNVRSLLVTVSSLDNCLSS